MYFLILNILFSSCFILCVKWVQGHRKMDVVTVGSINYIAAALCALPAFLNVQPSEKVGQSFTTKQEFGVSLKQTEHSSTQIKTRPTKLFW